VRLKGALACFKAPFRHTPYHGIEVAPMFERGLHYVDKVLTFFEEWTLFITVMVALIALFFNVVL
jgi:hypothetical protein